MIGWTRMPSRITASVYGMDSSAAPAGKSTRLVRQRSSLRTRRRTAGGRNNNRASAHLELPCVLHGWPALAHRASSTSRTHGSAHACRRAAPWRSTTPAATCRAPKLSVHVTRTRTRGHLSAGGHVGPQLRPAPPAGAPGRAGRATAAAAARSSCGPWSRALPPAAHWLSLAPAVSAAVQQALSKVMQETYPSSSLSLATC